MKRIASSVPLLLAASVAAVSSCSSPGKGALVVAISTDMQTPKDVDILSVYVATNSVPKFDYLGLVTPQGTVPLPSTLAIVEPDDPGAQVRIRITAFKDNKPLVTRDVLTTVPHQRTALLRLPLDFLDQGSVTSGQLPAQYVPNESTVADGITQFDPTDPTNIVPYCDFSKGLTMIDGTCQGATVASSSLPAYEQAQVFGDAGLQPSGDPASCFDVQKCFQGSTLVSDVNLGTCSFPLPLGADPGHLNLAIVTPTTGACLAANECYVPLPQDPSEGWSVSGSTVNLAAGICAQFLKQGARLGPAQLYVSAGVCAAQALSNPVCEPTSPDAGEVFDATVDSTPEVGGQDTGFDAPTTDGPTCGGVPCTGCCNAGTCEPYSAQSNSSCGTAGASCAACGSGQNCSGGSCVASPSCAGGGAGMTDCGGGTASCCASLQVTGGMYSRTYTNSGDGGTGEADPATVSNFRLDQYEVTVGRFRQFVTAWNGGSGWTPPSGSGKHTHLNGGQGLANSGSAGTYETGWVTTDNSNIQPTNTNLGSCTPYSTWTNSASSQEDLPINCVNWWESYAFCIWDGGFLPSESEWEYAAAGGSQQLEYPWGATAPGTACPGTGCQYAIYNCDYPNGSGSCTGPTNLAPVGTATLGAGLWGQLDLAGNVGEWNLDWYAAYVDPCVDCAYLTTASLRVLRGGAFYAVSSAVLPALRGDDAPTLRYYGIGLRCARTP